MRTGTSRENRDWAVGCHLCTAGVPRGFRNQSTEEAYLLAFRVAQIPTIEWSEEIRAAAAERGFTTTDTGVIARKAEAMDLNSRNA